MIKQYKRSNPEKLKSNHNNIKHIHTQKDKSNARKIGNIKLIIKKTTNEPN